MSRREPCKHLETWTRTGRHWPHMPLRQNTPCKKSEYLQQGAWHGALMERLPFSGDSNTRPNVLFFSNYANSVKIVITYNISPALERLKKCKKTSSILSKSKVGLTACFCIRTGGPWKYPLQRALPPFRSICPFMCEEAKSPLRNAPVSRGRPSGTAQSGVG